MRFLLIDFVNFRLSSSEFRLLKAIIGVILLSPISDLILFVS